MRINQVRSLKDVDEVVMKLKRLEAESAALDAQVAALKNMNSNDGKAHDDQMRKVVFGGGSGDGSSLSDMKNESHIFEYSVGGRGA